MIWLHTRIIIYYKLFLNVVLSAIQYYQKRESYQYCRPIFYFLKVCCCFVLFLLFVLFVSGFLFFVWVFLLLFCFVFVLFGVFLVLFYVCLFVWFGVVFVLFCFVLFDRCPLGLFCLPAGWGHAEHSPYNTRRTQPARTTDLIVNL